MISSIGSYSSADSTEKLSKMAAKMMKRIDTNSDGGIDSSEIQSLLDQSSDSNPSAEEIMKKLDTDGDSKISQEEIEKTMEAKRAEMDQMRSEMQARFISGSDATSRADEMFANLDTNSDGSIDKTEMQAMVDKGDGKGPGVDEIFAQFDSDNSGTIDKTENAKALEQGPPPPPPPPEEESADSEQSGISKDALSYLMDALKQSTKENSGLDERIKQLFSDLQNSLQYGQSGVLAANQTSSFLSVTA